ncbi:MAG TPA: LLM class flavin-dependent oxidoreductase, partial [Acidimicrobiales bacterium]|nr:LLM class flavin-dependent oxidoreductase [Acidimicrobiales bacterium]
LQARVLATVADVGLAFDGDADRVFLVDEKAQLLSGSLTTAIVADEMLARLATLWRGGWVGPHGEFYDVPRLEMTPPPPAPVPILVGGMSDAALRRAARHDGWISDLISTADAATHAARLDALRADAGRTGAFDVIVSLSDAVTADQFRRAEEVGVTDVLTMPWVYHGGFDLPLDQKLDGMRRFADEVVGPLAD